MSLDNQSYVLDKDEDVVLCLEEVCKLIAFLRSTDKYGDVSKPMSLWPRDPVVTAVGIPSPVPTVASPATEQHSPVEESQTHEQAPHNNASPRTTPVASSVVASSASGTNTLSQLVELGSSYSGHQKNFFDSMQVLAPIIAIVRDPGISGHVTAEALGSVLRILECGSVEKFLQNVSIIGFVVDSVTRTRFTETDRDNDETVLLRIIDIVQLALTRGCVDKARVASGLQCIQTIWIHEFHSSALRDAARRAVFRILKSAIIDSKDGYDGYAQTLMDNISLNIELLARQPNSTFDSDKLSFFIDVLGLMTRRGTVGKSHHIRPWTLEMSTYQINNALFWLIPAGPSALTSDSSSHGVLIRNSSALPIASGLLAIGNHVVGENLMHPSSTSAITIESILSSMYLRPLMPTIHDDGANFAFEIFSPKKGQLISPLVANGGYHKLSDGTSSTMILPMVQPIQATLLESLVSLLSQVPQLALTLFESFDGVWHRSEICSHLIDSVIALALQNRAIAIPKDKNPSNELHRYLEAFYSYGTSGDITIDPSAHVPTYTECLAMDVLRKMVDGARRDVYDKKPSAEDDKKNVFEWQKKTRTAAKETAKLISQKPKKAHEYIENFLNEYSVHPPVAAKNSLAWALRVNPYIDFETLGEFFGQPTETSSKALAEFIKSLNLKIMDPEEALRSCLQAFRLPGEAQQIDRIIKEIAYEYYASHSDLSVPGNYFASADAAYTFLFSVIMLNTDQHNPQVKKRMELKDFLRNNRKINEGEDIPEEVQTRVFNSIRNSQIVTPKSSSWFCCPLKARWRDLFYMSKTGFIPNEIRSGVCHETVTNFLKAKGPDILITASYMLGKDPARYTCAVEVIAGLGELALSREDEICRSIGSEAINVLRRYGMKSFATTISGITPTSRSFACLRALFDIKTGSKSLDSLLEADAAMLCYWSNYSHMMFGSDFTMKDSWAKILSLPVLDPSVASGGSGLAASSSGITSIFRGLLNPLYENEVPSIDNRSETPVLLHEDEDMSPHGGEGGGIEKRFSVDSFGDMKISNDWRTEVLRTSFRENGPNAPPGKQLLALKQVEVDRFLAELVSKDSQKTSALILMMLELVLNPSRISPDEFWQKELVRSSPWVLLQSLRMLHDSKGSDLLASSAARDAVIAVIRHYENNTLLSDLCGLKIVVFVSFAFMIVFSQRDPTGDIVDPSSWILPVLDEMSTLCGKSNLMLGLGPIVCMCIRTLLMEAPAAWVRGLGTPVWRELFRIISLVCPSVKSQKNLLAEIETTKNICHETALIVLLNHQFLSAFATSANAPNDMSECIVSFERIISTNRGPARVCKHLTDLACKLAGMGSHGPGVGVAWTAIVGRITARVTAVTKQKKPTGNELSDVVELLRMCLGDPRAVQIVTPAQAGATIERCASTLTSVVSADTPPGALQAALCVFARFFLLCLDKLIQHPQFDHLWLMSLRVVLLFIKRGHDDASMEQLAEITTETLRNALQVLVASKILQLPSPADSDEDNPVWWKVTWETVETFCPGMIEDLIVDPANLDQNTPPEDMGGGVSPKQLEVIQEHPEEVSHPPSSPSRSPNASLVI